MTVICQLFGSFQKRRDGSILHGNPRCSIPLAQSVFALFVPPPKACYLLISPSFVPCFARCLVHSNMFDGVFDYANPWIITVQDPEHPINSTVGALRWYVSYAVTDAICDSIQSGACFIALIMVLILTKPEKRATVVFIANVTALCSCFIGLLCNAIFYTTVNNDPLPSLAHVYFERPLPTGSVVDPVLSQLLIAVTVIAIEISLLKQAITVTKSTVEGPLRIPLFIFLVCVALAAIVVRLVFTVEMVIVQFDSGFPVHRKMEVATEVTFSISVVLVSIILVWKLSVTILTRRQLGITRSGPTQIIVVMFGQTMIVPGMFTSTQMQSACTKGAFSFG